MGAAALAIGAGIQAYSSIKKGMDESAGYKAAALNKQAQAAQVAIATDRQVLLTQDRFDKIRNAQAVAVGRSGTALSGSNLAQMETTAAEAVSQISAIRDAGNYHRSSILTEGLYDNQLAGQAESAGYLGALGAGLGAVAKNPYSYDTPVSSGGIA